MQKLPGLTGMIFFFIMDHWTISKRHIRFTCFGLPCSTCSINFRFFSNPHFFCLAEFL